MSGPNGSRDGMPVGQYRMTGALPPEMKAGLGAQELATIGRIGVERWTIQGFGHDDQKRLPAELGVGPDWLNEKLGFGRVYAIRITGYRGVAMLLVKMALDAVGKDRVLAVIGHKKWSYPTKFQRLALLGASDEALDWALQMKTEADMEKRRAKLCL